MSVADIKREVLHLTDEERWEVSEFLQQLSQKNESGELSRINAEMTAGKRVSLEEAIKRHEALVSQGR